MASKFWGDDTSTNVVDDKNLYIPTFEYRFMEKLNDENETLHKDMLYKAKELGLRIVKGKGADVYRYEGEEITICEEPIMFLKEFADISDNKEKAHKKFVEEIIPQCKKIKLDKQPELKIASENSPVRMWTGKTIDGINLRPGNLNDDRADFKGIKMSDDNVHGLIAGRTGSGKSVYINALILSLLTEYAPWELDLYLADFKKVELSRYMNDGDEANHYISNTPHIKACAATSEIRYVVSLIRHLVDCMNARNEFFTRLGVTKIQEFRDTYNVVLPRVLLIVDEFQQLFSDATNRETEEIQTMLNSITKLGRATGFHLVFASQEMSGTLRGNTLANFKIRMTLPCNKEISMDILGNGAAADLERGYVLVNTESGNEIDNLKYRVPFIQTEKKDDAEDKTKTDFYQFLDNIKLESEKYDLSYKADTQKFYREELQELEQGEITGYLNDLEKIRQPKNAAMQNNEELFDGVVLGKTVLYSEKKNDKVSFYIERGRNKGVMIASPSTDDIAKIRKLLVENLSRSDAPMKHIALELNRIVYGRFRIDNYFKNHHQSYVELNQESFFEMLRTDYLLRKYAMEFMKNSKNRFLINRYKNNYEQLKSAVDDEEIRQEIIVFFDRKDKLTEELAKLSGEKIEYAPKKKKVINPLVQCIDAIETMKFEGVNQIVIKGTKIYKKIVSDLNKTNNVEQTMLECLTYLKEEKAKTADQNTAAQLGIFFMCLGYFKRRVSNETPKVSAVSAQAKIVFDKYEVAIRNYISSTLAESEKEQKLSSLNEKISELESQLQNMDLEPNKWVSVINELQDDADEYVSFCYTNMYAVMKLKKVSIPTVSFKISEGKIDVQLTSSYEDEVASMHTDLVREMLETVSQFNDVVSVLDFPKRVYWVNGLDELDVVPKYLTDLIKDCLNYNILFVGSITSDLKDIMMKKAFDYAFITGNVERLYSMFGVKYTKQPMDSIVVNFGVRSKGLNIPFKMYKQRDLEEIETPTIIEDLLEL